MDIKKYLAECSTLSIPYRYDLGTLGDCGISYFVNNGLTQGLLSRQDGGPADHESLGIGHTQPSICSKCGSNILPESLNTHILFL